MMTHKLADESVRSFATWESSLKIFIPDAPSIPHLKTQAHMYALIWWISIALSKAL